MYKDIHNKDITINREKIDLTLKYYKQALYIYPEYSVCLNNLGTIYLIFYKQYELAIPYFQKAIDANPEYFDAHLNLGYSYEMINKYEEAIKYYRRAIEINPEHRMIKDKLKRIRNKFVIRWNKVQRTND